MEDDTPRPTATGDDKHTLTIEKVADRYSSAGHPRTIRTLQRYCVSGHLDCLKAPTKLGDMYLVTGESVARHIAELTEIFATTSVATDRGKPRLTAANDATQIPNEEPAATKTTIGDTPRPTATDAKYVDHLEEENKFLRGQLNIKDDQIKQANILTQGLQRLIAGLTGAPDPVAPREGSLHLASQNNPANTSADQP
jgi:hypothetical protein